MSRDLDLDLTRDPDGDRLVWRAAADVAALRPRMEREAARLRALVRPSTEDEREATILVLTEAYPSKQGSGSAYVLQHWHDVLQDEPGWAIDKARVMIGQGRAGALGKPYAPTPTQFYELVRTITAPIRADLDRLGAALAVPAERRLAPPRAGRSLGRDIERTVRSRPAPPSAIMVQPGTPEWDAWARAEPEVFAAWPSDTPMACATPWPPNHPHSRPCGVEV